MKLRIAVFLTLFFLTKITNAQNIVTLDVKSLTDASKITLKEGLRTLNLKDTLTLRDTNWVLKVLTNTSGCKIKIQNNVPPFSPITIDTIQDQNEYLVQANNLGNRIVLGSSFGISVLKNDGSLVKKYSQIKYLKMAKKLSSTPSSPTLSLLKEPPKEPPSEYKAGSVVFDALFLADSSNDIITRKEILAYYAGLDKTASIEEIKSNLASDSLIQDYLNILERQLMKMNAGQQSTGLFSILSGSSLGGLDVTSIADGFAKFIVKRAKKELNNAFFDRFKEFINKYPDLQSVFPQTYRAMSIIGDEIYNYEAYIQTLRESFENDLSTLDKNLPSIINNHPEFFHNYPSLAATLNSGCYIAGALEDKIHPGDILKDYPDHYLDSLNTNWKGAMQTLQLISASLRDTATQSDSVYWVSPRQVKTLMATKNAFKIYLGLIYQQAKNNYESIHFNYKGTDTTLTGIINKLHGHEEDISDYQDFVTHFIEKADKLNKMIKNYKKADNDSLAFAQYYSYFNSSVDLLQHCTEISKLPNIKGKIPDLQVSLKDYFDVAHSAADLVLDIKRRNYSSAVVNAVHIYDLVKAKYSANPSSASAKAVKKANKKLQNDVEDLIKAAAADPNKSFTALAVDSLKKATEKTTSEPKNTKLNRQSSKSNSELAKDLIENTPSDKSLVINKEVLDSLRKESDRVVNSGQKNDVLKKFYKYGTFMAAMVQAKSSDDVEKVIEAFALPTGSSKIKRVSDFNVSVNSFAGLFYGYEKINSVDSGKVKPNVYGLAAPIGVAASWGHRLFFVPTGTKEWSTSVFVTLVDLGAVAAFRFRDDSTAQVPTIQLRDIFSPGAFLSIGIPKCPLSVNLGAQVGPNLRKINTTDPAKLANDYNNKMYWRYSLSVCVDIPLLNLYTKSK